MGYLSQNDPENMLKIPVGGAPPLDILVQKV